MATNPYISLYGSTGLPTNHYFRVILPEWGETYQKSQQIRKTASGDWDITEGSVKRILDYIIRVRHTEPVSGYGTVDDLKNLYLLNDPGATPHNRLSFVDHYGGSPITVMMVGDFRKQIMGIEIEGNEAWFLVKIALYVL